MTSAQKAARLKTAEERVRKALNIETLVTQKRDALDFHDVSVWSIRQAVEIAFEEGFAAGIEAAKNAKVKS